ncbi:MAG: type II secretion system protein E, partial [Nocardioides sp.]|nr:type II secretion system protein E [Nocardioides sp.]
MALESLLTDPAIIEVAINPDGEVWFEKQGAVHMERASSIEPFSQRKASELARAIASDIKHPLSSDSPSISGKIDYKGRPLRAQIIIDPIVEMGCSITFRAYNNKKLDLAEIVLLGDGLLDLEAERQAQVAEVKRLAGEGDIKAAMAICVEQRLNIVVSGGTSTGKTTFTRALLEMIDPDERIVTIEDAFELFPPQRNHVCMKASRRENSPVSAAKLLEASLRMRPDRIMLGELRGSECKTFLDAINTGHSGSFTTIHADSGVKAIDRLALMVMSVGINMSYGDVRRYCASTIDLVIQLGR